MSGIVPSMKLNNLIVRLLRSVDQCRLYKKEVSKFLSDQELNILVNGEFMKKEEAWPIMCLFPHCNNPVNCKIEGGKLIVTDVDLPMHSIAVDIDDYIIYEINLFRCFFALLSNLIGNSEIELDKQIKESCRIEVRTESDNLYCFCSISNSIRDSNLRKFLETQWAANYPKIIILKRSDENMKILGHFINKYPDNLIKHFYLKGMVNDKTKKQLDSWIVGTRTEENGDMGEPGLWLYTLFYLFVLVVILVIACIVARTVPVVVLPIVLIFGIISLSLIGAFHLFLEGKLSPENFIKLISKILDSLTLLGGKKHTGNNNESQES